MNSSRRFSNTLLPKRSENLASSYEADILPAVILNMADRISALEGLRRVEPASHGASTLCIFEFRGTEMCPCADDEAMPFVTVDLAGRITLEVTSSLHNEILRSHWGYEENGRITTHAPRDEVEASIIWRIMLAAYFDAFKHHSLYKDRSFGEGNKYKASKSEGLTRGTFF